MPNRAKGWKILLAVDGSAHARRAVDAAAQIPWPRGSEFKVITVVERRAGLPQTAAALRNRAEALVEAARARVEKAGRVAAPAVLVGAAAQAILDTARSWRADVVVLGSRGLGAVRAALLGSVSAAVARAAPSSVLVLKGPLRTPLRAVAAVDGSKDARVAARRLARLGAPGSAVTVVRVITPPRVASLGLLPGRVSGAIRAELRSVVGEMQSRAGRDVRAVGRVFREAGWKVDAVVRSGEPFVELLAAAERAGARLIGVGPCGVTGIKRILLGSVTERLLGHPRLSVFIGR